MATTNAPGAESAPLQSYELMLIFTPVLAEDEFKAAQQRYQDIITNNGGSIVHSDAWGLKTLAYPIQKKTTGLYWVLEYQAPGDVNAKLETQLGRDESLMRQMFTRLDKHAVAYNDRKRNGIKLEHTPKNAKSEEEAEA